MHFVKTLREIASFSGLWLYSFLSLLTIHVGYEASKKCVNLFVHLVVVRD